MCTCICKTSTCVCVIYLIYKPTSIEISIYLWCLFCSSILSFVVSVVTELTLQFCNVIVYLDFRFWWKWNFTLWCQKWLLVSHRDMAPPLLLSFLSETLALCVRLHFVITMKTVVLNFQCFRNHKSDLIYKSYDHYVIACIKGLFKRVVGVSVCGTECCNFVTQHHKCQARFICWSCCFV